MDPLKADGKDSRGRGAIGGSVGMKPDARDVRGIGQGAGRSERHDSRGDMGGEGRRDVPGGPKGGYMRDGPRDAGGVPPYVRRPGGEPPRDNLRGAEPRDEPPRRDTRIEPRDGGVRGDGGRGEHRDVRVESRDMRGVDAHRGARGGGAEPLRGGDHRAPRGGPPEGDAPRDVRREPWSGIRGGDLPPPPSRDVRGDRDNRVVDHRRPGPGDGVHDFRGEPRDSRDPRDGRGDIIGHGGRPDHRDRVHPPGVNERRDARGGGGGPMMPHPRAESGEGDTRLKPSPGAGRSAGRHPSPNKGGPDQRSMAGNQKGNIKLTLRVGHILSFC